MLVLGLPGIFSDFENLFLVSPNIGMTDAKTDRELVPSTSRTTCLELDVAPTLFSRFIAPENNMSRSEAFPPQHAFVAPGAV